MILSQSSLSVFRNGIGLSQPALLTSAQIGPSLGLDLRDGAVDRGPIADVDRVGRDRRLRRELRGFLSRIGLDVEDRDLAAFFGEPKGDAAPDALAAAGDDRHLTG